MIDEENNLPAAPDLPEEVVENVVEQEVEAAPEESVDVELTDQEQEALAQGWKPSEEFDESASGKEFVSAEEYLNRGKFYKKMSEQSREIKDLKNTITDISSHLKRSDEAVYERALKELQGKKREAVETGDVDTFDQIEKAERDIHTRRDVGPAPSKDMPVAVLEFTERNKWFNVQAEDKTDLAMTSYAIAVDNSLMGKHPDLSESERLYKVEQEVKEMYPQKFKNTNRAAPSAVLASRKGAAKKSSRLSELPEEFQAVGRRLIKRIPGMTEESYIADLIKQGVIENDR